ncbi:conjugal transfer protein TraK [Maribacter sp. 2307ULW6-5]|uniref:conjugal transfer protein TraK n=1 Tax=Maribacter sp. 2307ULW6-5 TaxID=3386275 RepID=UPI0039BC9BCB
MKMSILFSKGRKNASFSYNNIHSLFRVNRLIVWSVVLMAFASSSFSGWMVYKIHKESLENVFAIDSNGEVVPLVWANESQHLEIEAMAHLERFHQLFYGMDASTFEAHLDKALWWGDASVDNLYQQKKTDGTYNRLLQFSLIQEVVSVETQLEITRNSIPFSCSVQFVVKRGSVTDRYELETTGILTPVERHFPNNPHGLLITEFFEKSLKKQNDATR